MIALHHSLVIRSHEIPGVKAFINATKALIETHGWCPKSDNNGPLDLQTALLQVDFKSGYDGVTTEILYVKTRNFLQALLDVESLLVFDGKVNNTQRNVLAFLDYAAIYLSKKGFNDED